MIRAFTLRLYEKWLDDEPKAGRLPPGVALEVWDSPATAGPGGARWHPEASARFREGQLCVVARAGTEVVSYCWLTVAPVSVVEIDRLLVPGPDEVYFYDAFTAPSWRGRGLFSAVLWQLQAVARKRGRRRAMIFVLASNVPSWRAIERTGFEMFQEVSKIELLGLGRVWFRGPLPGRAR